MIIKIKTICSNIRLFRESAYWKIKFHDTDQFFIISTKFGGIRSKEDLDLIFGRQ